MDIKEFSNAVRVVGRMANSTHPKNTLAWAVADGEVSRESGSWIDAALNCVNGDDVVSIACEFLLADAREGFVPEGEKS